jgi:hypothetical protein
MALLIYRMLNLYVVPPHIELISLYQKSYNPMQVNNWDDIYEKNDKLLAQ